MYPHPKHSQHPGSSSATLPFSEVQMESPALHWWYSISAPRAVSANASLEQREVVRRGRVASLILPVIIALVLLPVPTALGNPILLFTLAVIFFLDMTALFVLNRTGHVTAAGILVVIGIELGVGVSVLTFPGGLGPSNLPLFDLMTQALVVAVAMLPPPTVFLIAVINSLFTVIVLHSNAINPELTHIVATNLQSVLPPPITLQIAIAWFTFILLRSTNQAIRRADRAEELAALAQQNIELQQRELQRTYQIEEGIEQMLAAMASFMNGDTMARVPESQENVLWKIGRALNNLLARLKDYQKKSVQLEQARKEIEALQNRLNKISSQSELQKTYEAAAQLKEAIRLAKSNHAPLEPLPHSDTVIDEITMELFTIRRS